MRDAKCKRSKPERKNNGEVESDGEYEGKRRRRRSRKEGERCEREEDKSEPK
jgi:hypothetical protein